MKKKNEKKGKWEKEKKERAEMHLIFDFNGVDFFGQEYR